MLVQKMDEEDGVSLSNTNDMKDSPKNYAPLVDPAFLAAADRANAQSQASKAEVKPEAPIAAWIGRVSVFKYLDSEGVVLNQALNGGNITLLLGLALIAIVISLYAFENRDING